MKTRIIAIAVTATAPLLASCQPQNKPILSIEERMSAIESRLADWQPMVNMLEIRQGSDGRYQLIVKIPPHGTADVFNQPEDASLTPAERLDRQAEAMCAMSKTVGRLEIRKGSTGLEQPLALSKHTTADEERFCPTAHSAARLPEENRITVHETMLDGMGVLLKDMAFCWGSDGRIQALIIRPDDTTGRCKQKPQPR